MIPIQGLEPRLVETDGLSVFVQAGGAGPPLLLLHGFPQTHLMWREVVPHLAASFTIVCADLSGYGSSSCPTSRPDHAPHSKRAMARALVAVMARLGFAKFAVAGHDRGGRVAYRTALDHPGAVTALAVLDVVPTLAAWERADARLALAFWPWSLLSQPEPLPERLVASAPDAVVDDALSNWGTPASSFPAEIRAAYVEALRDPVRVHAICEEYRAAAGIDREHDEADRAAGRRIRCPVLALWSRSAGLGTWYTDEGGPLAIWRGWADDVRGEAVAGGHFFPEEAPGATAQALRAFVLTALAAHGTHSPQGSLPDRD